MREATSCKEETETMSERERQQVRTRMNEREGAKGRVGYNE